MNMLNLWAEIIPESSAGGFRIGQHLSSIPDLREPILVVNLQEEREKREKGLKSININEALSNSDGWICQKISSDSQKLDGHKVFYYKDRIVLLEFNSDDILFEIFVFEGYKGKFLDKFEIGTRLSDLREHFELDYDNGDELNYPSESSSVKGIGFYGAEESLEDNLEQKIMGFCVHNWSLQV
ncbi:hypothetical protein LC653_29875 [Nostoc sp. CHAB 5784]|uniref:hypothetical protein n=1 Tax=Nostoc mirabile TaxID=2907820 RepID=UPI001E57DF5E|nr:hypothetical protein [Nostoc mirabile]MCC5667968.1 hypothetical protein [Nostoc mirabile CHAB5784]